MSLLVAAKMWSVKGRGGGEEVALLLLQARQGRLRRRGARREGEQAAKAVQAKVVVLAGEEGVGAGVGVGTVRRQQPLPVARWITVAWRLGRPLGLPTPIPHQAPTQ